MRVPKIVTSRNSWNGPRRALLEITEDEETGRQRLNHLCGACRSLQFDFKAARDAGLEETLPVKLYDGISDTFESALGGCHLCAVFVEALGAALYELRVEKEGGGRFHFVDGGIRPVDGQGGGLEGGGDEEDARDDGHDEGGERDEGEHDENSGEEDEDEEEGEEEEEEEEEEKEEEEEEDDDDEDDDDGEDEYENENENEDDDDRDLARETWNTNILLAPDGSNLFNLPPKLVSVVDQNTLLSNAESLALLTQWFPGPVLLSCKRDRESLRVFYKNNDAGALHATVSLSHATDSLDKTRSFQDQRGMQLALSICQGTHRLCHKSKSLALPKRLIDIRQGLGNLRLIDTLPLDDLQHGYAAVSHRWSPDLSCKLTSQTKTEYQQRIPPSDLPPHFRDAILLARALYLDFIWIDSICIIQAGDGGNDWLAQAPEMANIYRGAELVISLDSTEAWRGFLHISPRQTQPCAIPSLKSKRAAVGPLPTFQQAVDLGDLESRAWTMQERLLARRVLHCTGWGLVWECAEANTGLEDIQHERSMFAKGTQHGLPLYAEPRPYIPVRWGDYSTYPVCRLVSTQPFFAVWYRLVEQYSYRKLTVAADRLIAVAGLARQFSACGTGPMTYLAGIWAQDLAYGLSWEATDNLSNLPDGQRTHLSQMRNPSSSGMVSADLLPYRAPSWSWASVDCSIDYESLDDCYRDPAPKSDYAPALVSYKFENGNDDPFGIPASASITMRGLCADHLAFMQPAYRVTVGDARRSSDEQPPELLGRTGLVTLDRNGVELSEEGFRVWSDEPLEMMPRGTVVFLLWKSQTVEGLVLVPVGETSSCYRRIGKWAIGTYDSGRALNVDLWRERTLTLV